MKLFREIKDVCDKFVINLSVERRLKSMKGFPLRALMP